MPIPISELMRHLTPHETVLLFGSGSSLPSNAPSVRQLQDHFEREFHVSGTDYSLSEQTGIIEFKTRNRRSLISSLRSRFKGLKPSGSLLNLPLYGWKSIFTTNYDTFIEDVYKLRGVPAQAYSSNFDFGPKDDPRALQIFKLHGTIDKDISDGVQSRIILTQNDYDFATEFRENLFDRFRGDISGSHLVVIGHSLVDPDIKSVVDRAHNINLKYGGGGRITVLSYSKDLGRAELFESRGINVCFGSLDDFFAGLIESLSTTPPQPAMVGGLLSKFPSLQVNTIDISDVLGHSTSIGSMINGWPASFADIKAGYTFQRNAVNDIVEQFRSSQFPISIILGPSGVGKTTLARQALVELLKSNIYCFEHKSDQLLYAQEWRAFASHLKSIDAIGCLFVDNAHADLNEVNELCDYLSNDGNKSIFVILASSSSQWQPRIKSPSVNRRAKEYPVNKVQSAEIDRLLDLSENVPEVHSLVDDNFKEYSRGERRRRLEQKCEADMFVCLKNIFSSEGLNAIVLREYADLERNLQEVYKIVAAMESAGVHVHRQMIIRMLGIPANQIEILLSGLSDVIHEQTIDEREGVYAWKGRHRVIMNIIAEHKYFSEQKRFTMLKQVVDAISPSYEIEIRTIRELCNTEYGLSTLSDKREQNTLLRKMCTAAPKERVPRHRLIRNLVSLGEYDQAEVEIKLFSSDFQRLDGPATRYKIDLAVARAVRSDGIMEEDRIVMLEKAREVASAAATRFKGNKAVLTSYCEVGLETARLTGSRDIFDIAISHLKAAEESTADKEISRRIAGLEARLYRVMLDGDVEFSAAHLDDDMTEDD